MSHSLTNALIDVMMSSVDWDTTTFLAPCFRTGNVPGKSKKYLSSHIMLSINYIT